MSASNLITEEPRDLLSSLLERLLIVAIFPPTTRPMLRAVASVERVGTGSVNQATSDANDPKEGEAVGQSRVPRDTPPPRGRGEPRRAPTRPPGSSLRTNTPRVRSQ